MNRTAFYAAVRTSVFGGQLSTSQVDGLNNLLDVWDKYFSRDSDFLLAYDLGTAFHETAGTMQPITERGGASYFDKYEPGTKLGKMLGNTVKGDGFKFRGEGHVQNTGRRNAGMATKRINELFGLGIDLVKNPEKRGDPFISAISLFLGNKEGWWTGKDLLDYIDGVAEGDQEELREFTEARRVVNGTDKAATIAGYALSFYKAIVTASETAPGAITDAAIVTPAVHPDASADPAPAPVIVAPTATEQKALPVDIKDLQQTLKDKGYVEVGVADGKVGPNTLAAIAAFQIAQGLPVNGAITPELVVQVRAAPMRPVSAERANATTADLVDQNVAGAKEGVMLKRIGGAVTATMGLGAVLDGGPVDLDHVMSSATKAHAIYVMLGNLAPWLIGGAIGIAVLYFGHGVISKQLEGFRKGTVR